MAQAELEIRQLSPTATIENAKLCMSASDSDNDNDYLNFGESPVVVFHAVPGGTVQSPKQSYSQSVSAMICFCALTNSSTGHIPSFCVGQPRMPVSGTTPSLMTMRICGSATFEQESTGVDVESKDKRRRMVKRTLELNVGAERRELRRDERSVGRDMIRRKGPVHGEVREIERRDDCTNVRTILKTKRSTHH